MAFAAPEAAVAPGHVFLIGNRGSGKTYIGMRLAQALGASFVDLDQYLVAQTGRQISEIVAASGWDEFRLLESGFLRTAVASAAGPTVFATGGGIVLSGENCGFMKAMGRVVWLDAPLDCICSRLALEPGHAGRPSLTGRDMLEELADIYQRRKSLYARACHFSVDASRDWQDICGEIMSLAGEKN